MLIATEFWEELGTTGPLAVVAAASLSMLIAGIVVPETAGEHGGRLRAVLWAAATGAFAGFVALLARTR